MIHDLTNIFLQKPNQKFSDPSVEKNEVSVDHVDGPNSTGDSIVMTKHTMASSTQ